MQWWHLVPFYRLCHLSGVRSTHNFSWNWFTNFRWYSRTPYFGLALKLATVTWRDNRYAVYKRQRVAASSNLNWEICCYLQCTSFFATVASSEGSLNKGPVASLSWALIWTPCLLLLWLLLNLLDWESSTIDWCDRNANGTCARDILRRWLDKCSHVTVPFLPKRSWNQNLPQGEGQQGYLLPQQLGLSPWLLAILLELVLGSYLERQLASPWSLLHLCYFPDPATSAAPMLSCRVSCFKYSVQYKLFLHKLSVCQCSWHQFWNGGNSHWSLIGQHNPHDIRGILQHPAQLKLGSLPEVWKYWDAKITPPCRVYHWRLPNSPVTPQLGLRRSNSIGTLWWYCGGVANNSWAELYPTVLPWHRISAPLVDHWHAGNMRAGLLSCVLSSAKLEMLSVPPQQLSMCTFPCTRQLQRKCTALVLYGGHNYLHNVDIKLQWEHSLEACIKEFGRGGGILLGSRCLHLSKHLIWCISLLNNQFAT